MLISDILSDSFKLTSRLMIGGFCQFLKKVFFWNTLLHSQYGTFFNVCIQSHHYWVFIMTPFVHVWNMCLKSIPPCNWKNSVHEKIINWSEIYNRHHVKCMYFYGKSSCYMTWYFCSNICIKYLMKNISALGIYVNHFNHTHTVPTLHNPLELYWAYLLDIYYISIRYL